jgi:membrane-associated phospholipid phosphatase
MPNPTLDFGLQIILYLQSLGEWLAAPMQAISFLGNEEFFLLIMPILYWCLDTGIGLRIGLMLLLSSGLNSALKLVFHTPRPFYYSEAVQAFDDETTFGVPSGHAQNAAAVWGLLAALLSRRLPAYKTLIWGLALLLIFLIGLSRLFVGMHFPTDVLFGWAVGFALVWAFLRLEAPVSARLQALPLGSSILSVFGASLLLILFAVLARLSLNAWTVPQAWLDTAALTQPAALPDPLALASVFTSAGALFGFGAGALWLRANGGFDAGGPTWKRLARYPLGLIGVLLLWFGLGAVFPREEAVLSYALRYLRYALVGLWVSALAPLLYIRLGLAQGANPAPSIQATTSSTSSHQ